MRHKWTKIDNKETKYYEPSAKVLETHECKVCGCIRQAVLFSGQHWKQFIYKRDGILYDIAPKCIDWNDNKVVQDEAEPLMFLLF